MNQQYINETDQMKGGANRATEHAANAFKAFSGLLGMSFLGGFLSGWAAAQASERGEGHHHRRGDHHHHRPQRHPEPLYLNFLRWV